MKDVQDKAEKFNKKRERGKVADIKNPLLNMSEEIREFWNIIKWVDPETQKELIEKNIDDKERNKWDK